MEETDFFLTGTTQSVSEELEWDARRYPTFFEEE